jgi:8-oxo-dGTP diphosphatase
MSKIPFPSGLKRGAVFCILKCKNRYLLLKRYKNPHKDKYVPVGGKIDPHESPDEAVIRETFEETGITLSQIEYCGTLVETSPVDYNWMSIIYCAEIEYQPAPNCDEGILEWVDSSDLSTIDTPPTDWHIYQYVDRAQKFAFDAIFDADLNMISMVDKLSESNVDLTKKNQSLL